MKVEKVLVRGGERRRLGGRKKIREGIDGPECTTYAFEIVKNKLICKNQGFSFPLIGYLRARWCASSSVGVISRSLARFSLQPYRLKPP